MWVSLLLSFRVRSRTETVPSDRHDLNCVGGESAVFVDRDGEDRLAFVI